MLCVAVATLLTLASSACAQFMVAGGFDTPDYVYAPHPMMSALIPYGTRTMGGVNPMFYMGNDLPDFNGDMYFLNRRAPMMGKKKRKKRFVSALFPPHPLFNPLLGGALAAGAFARANARGAFAQGAAVGAATAARQAATFGVGPIVGPQVAQPFHQRPVMPQPMQPIAPMQPVQPMQPMQPMQPVQPIQPIQPIQPVQPVQVIQPQPQTMSISSLQPISVVDLDPVGGIDYPGFDFLGGLGGLTTVGSSGGLTSVGGLGSLDNLFGTGSSNSIGGFAMTPDDLGMQTSSGIVQVDSLMSPYSVGTARGGMTVDLGQGAVVDPWTGTSSTGGMPLVLGADLLDLKYII